MCNFPGNFDEYVNQLPTNELIKWYEKIVGIYQTIPVSEVWTANTVESTLRLLNYHYQMKHFNDKKTPLLICEQLLDVIDTLQNRLNKNNLNENDNQFKFYISEIDVGNTFILFKKPEQSSCLVRLFTLNGFYFSDEKFCKVVEHWLNSLTKRAMLISNASEKERFKFFDGQIDKIKSLITSFSQIQSSFFL